ncbi:GyrI-like domain-containing protein [Tundrisphaera sp. TA3]|uniref:GyrI-like domain-containing protein n=1 Tax=Tundrisphaera sp. TA3 TaxID=3435775 RepID=UPI003EBF758D
MVEPPQIVETADRLTACIPLVVPRAEIQFVMGPSLRELYATLAAQGIAPAGPWLTHHRRRPSDTFDFAVSVPVHTPVAPSGRVIPGRLAAARVARTVYGGPYEGLAGAWGELTAWVASRGLARCEDLWEAYLVGPESGRDPAAWRTELNQPLAD